MLKFKPTLGPPGKYRSNHADRDHRIRRRAPWQGALRVLIVAAIVFLTCLILLGLTTSFLVDWLWFSAIGYFGVFWTTIIAETKVFFAVFLATAIILLVNGLFAFRFARSQWTQRPAEFEWKPTGVATLPEVLEFTRTSAAVACRSQPAAARHVIGSFLE